MSENGNKKNQHRDLVLPTNGLRDFNPETPDWRREYLLLAAATVHLGACATDLVKHERKHAEELPPCMVSLLLLSAYLQADTMAHSVIERVPIEFFQKNAEEVVDVVSAEAEADNSNDRS